jgi:hypothetical protein
MVLIHGSVMFPVRMLINEFRSQLAAEVACI